MYRDPSLLKMARGMHCLLQIPGICGRNPDTTVACHSNQLAHGKGRAIKAHDYMSVWGCATCHTWLDQGPALKAKKVQAFDAAHTRQIQAWKDAHLVGLSVASASKAVAAYEASL